MGYWLGVWIMGIGAALCAAESPQADCVVFPLWQETIPGALGSEEKDKPMLYVYLPSDAPAPTPAVVICPGGGYAHLAMDHEGREIAERLRRENIAAIVLKYRLPGDGYRHPIPILDARRAIQTVRFHARDWNIHPDRIGILGFSAGGHLASTSGTFFEEIALSSAGKDAVGSVSYRPNFLVLVYPVISMQDEWTHRGSRANLLGPEPPQELIERLSNERQITKDTPPTFLIHADDDKTVLPENSILFYQGLRKAGIPAELHIYRKGGHGFGTRPTAGPAAGWLEDCLKWMKQMGFLPTEQPASETKTTSLLFLMEQTDESEAES
ncbi:MAG TPA: alpha/beta hydrolase [Anaerohalosphaeraceae bacterium]|nr:alpha/beta hydrolase [Anaerohalosphaeraceae bacterium]HOL88353.1 alpha/beta hydrolase [Anaerohalosphaeraceae bacterium]HPP55005.1 alpha/beta hydrolase [Anaerohalosphaeraceae bacterium]